MYLVCFVAVASSCCFISVLMGTCLHYLKSGGNFLYACAEKGDLEGVKTWIASGADINFQNMVSKFCHGMNRQSVINPSSHFF